MPDSALGTGYLALNFLNFSFQEEWIRSAGIKGMLQIQIRLRNLTDVT